MWELYDRMLAPLTAGERVTGAVSTQFWTLAETDRGGFGLAMTTFGDTRPPLRPGPVEGLPVLEAAQGVKSWNLEEASMGMAAVNAWYNTPARLAELGCEEPYDSYCTRGLDLAGKRVGVVGHLKMPPDTLREAKAVYILERNPQPGDYPDSACEYLLPGCDVVLITGSALVNKTLPRLLELCRGAYTILTGPTVPMCPALLELGLDRMAGLVCTDVEGARRHVESGRSGPPYPYGRTFLLTREGL